ncbi:hypothetical protein [Ruixingdingia sedimenti]|uniref:Cellulose biosynthesis protein BcsS n=1 Tax=Ruixingdingia sedimenti TaxID=3073604 RepID=A0ABU1F2D0_9RHOB|nr:hypothetical protein [Xinfangfangia sp. LG-4]MDR5651026.1 hypothetical protein [Xinfangfangia sp. LG-4]
MVGRGWLAIILWLASAAAAAAGPWPRERGEVFLAFAVEGDGAMSSYGEYGLGGGWTFGLDLALAGRGGGPGKRVAILRRSFTAGGVQIAAEAGFGLDARGQGYARPGIAIGRGFAGPVPGWMALDLRAELRGDGARYGAEATLGFRHGDRLMTVFQAQAMRDPIGGLWISSQSAVVWQARKGVQLELGLRHRIAAPIPGPAPLVGRAGVWISY